MNSAFSLNGKCALVTGGGRGIGKEIALAMAAAGANVAIVDRSTDASVLDDFAPLGVTAIALQADLSDPTAPKQVTAEVIGKLGKIDILVNNAGIIRRAPAIDFSEADWDEVMAINSRTPFFLSQAVAHDMLSRGYGKIINIASLLSFQGGILVPSYAASKGAIAQVTKALANEWAVKGININAIAPGYIATDNTAALRADASRSKAILDRIPAGRWGKPSDIAGTAVFLASPASDYINGHVLVVDGGWMAR